MSFYVTYKLWSVLGRLLSIWKTNNKEQNCSIFELYYSFVFCFLNKYDSDHFFDRSSLYQKTDRYLRARVHDSLDTHPWQNRHWFELTLVVGMHKHDARPLHSDVDNGFPTIVMVTSRQPRPQDPCKWNTRVSSMCPLANCPSLLWGEGLRLQ